MAADLTVAAREAGDGWDVQVGLGEGAGGKGHRFDVRVPRKDWERLTGGEATVEDLVHASFRFLLEREPASAILTRFDLMTIARYFPEYEQEMAAEFRDDAP